MSRVRCDPLSGGGCDDPGLHHPLPHRRLHGLDHGARSGRRHRLRHDGVDFLLAVPAAHVFDDRAMHGVGPDQQQDRAGYRGVQSVG